MNTRLTRHLVLWMALLLTCALGTVTVSASSHTVERIFGADRYETSVEISKRMVPGGVAVIAIATGENWPDALAGAPVEYLYGGPILLTRGGSIPPTVAEEIARIDTNSPTQALIFGGQGAVSQAVEAQLADLGVPVYERFAGANRYETAKLMAEWIDFASGYAVDTAYFVTGENFPDALAIGPVAGPLYRPILLVRRDSIPPETQAAIDEIGITNSIVLGGEGAISPAVMSALPAPVRIAGVDRYDTARLVAEHALLNGAIDDMAYVATGESFADALTTGPFAAWTFPGTPRPLLLTRRDSLPETTHSYFETHGSNITNLIVVGGPGAVDESVVDAIEEEIP